METILITGATGFIGSIAAARFSKLGYDILVLTRSTSDLSKLDSLKIPYKTFNIDTGTLDELFKENNITGILHFATEYVKSHKQENIQSMIYSNLTFPTLLANMAIEHDVKWFINTGSGFEFMSQNKPIDEEQPLISSSLYGGLKISFHSVLQSIRKSNMSIVTLRLFTPYGWNDTSQKVLPYTIKQAVEKLPIQLGDGFQRLDFTYVDDVVSAYVSTVNYLKAQSSSICDSFNIGTGSVYSIRDTITVLEDVLGYKIDVKFKQQGTPQFDYRANPDKAMRVLFWRPSISIYEGIKKTIKFWRGEIYE